MDPASTASAINLHFDSVPYGSLPGTQLAPAGIDNGQPYWLFGLGDTRVYGVVDTPSGGHGGITSGGIPWSAGRGVGSFHPVELMSESPYATPTPMLGAGSLTQPDTSDGIITGTLDGGGFSTAAAVREGNDSAAPVITSDGIPKWLLILGLVLLAMLVLKDK